MLVTSPIPSHPSTELMDGVISSFGLVGLDKCPLLIIADGVQMIEDLGRNEEGQITGQGLTPIMQRRHKKHLNENRIIWKQGLINNQAYTNYVEYVDKLRASHGQKPNVQVIGPLEDHLNFGHCLLYGLKMVKTKYVMVI